MTELEESVPRSGTTAAEQQRPWVGLQSDGFTTRLMGNSEGLRNLGRIVERCASDTSAGREYRSCGGAGKDLGELAGGEIAIVSIDLLVEPPLPPLRTGSKASDRVALVGCGLLVTAVTMVFFFGVLAIVGLVRLP